jgi:GTP-binding protein HflX
MLIMKARKKLHETTPKPERAFLVGRCRVEYEYDEEWDSIEELELLATTCGARVIGKTLQVKETIHPTLFLGKGKVQEIRKTCAEEDIDIVIFNDELTPRQIRNLENLLELRILDRTQVILDIFALHARTREAKIQVELAQLNYLLPRLTRMWTHLDRIRGGIGLRGPGETQLEVDKRRIRTKIASLRRKLGEIGTQHHLRRKLRQDEVSIALIGYTNTGKSTIMDRLTDSFVKVDNSLFTTLDATTRKIQFPHKVTVLLTDTVGFIRKLPHHLIASFKSTLEEVKEADLLLHVIDVSNPNFKAQIETVEDILSAIGKTDFESLFVYNKRDLLNGDASAVVESLEDSNRICISALNSSDIERLRDRIYEWTGNFFEDIVLGIPLNENDVLTQIYRKGDVIESRYEDDRVLLRMRMKKNDIRPFREYRVSIE